MAIFTVLVHFHIALWGRFWPFLGGFVGIFWGTPAIYFADFGAILTIFDHFWAIFGPFLGRKKNAFFPDFWHFGPGIRPLQTWQRGKISIAPPPPGATFID